MIITVESKYDIGQIVKVKFNKEERTVKITDIGVEITRRSARVNYGVSDPEIQSVLEEHIVGLGTSVAQMK